MKEEISEGRKASHKNLSRGIDEKKLKETRERNSLPPNDEDGGGDGAAKLFEQTSDIRRAMDFLRSEQRETRKRYKKALTTLEQGLAGHIFGRTPIQVRFPGSRDGVSRNKAGGSTNEDEVNRRDCRSFAGTAKRPFFSSNSSYGKID